MAVGAESRRINRNFRHSASNMEPLRREHKREGKHIQGNRVKK
jgi:hypothetical protein